MGRESGRNAVNTGRKRGNRGLTSARSAALDKSVSTCYNNYNFKIMKNKSAAVSGIEACRAFSTRR